MPTFSAFSRRDFASVVSCAPMLLASTSIAALLVAVPARAGHDINRAAPLIAGIDWRLDNGIVAGVAATYVATSAKFKDGSRTNVRLVPRGGLCRLGRRAVVRARKRGGELQRFRHLALAHALRASR